MKNNKYNRKGFTLVESLVALSIFLTVATVPMEIVIKSLQTNLLSKNNLEAHFKAQEIIEVARAIRDSNFVNGKNWLTSLSQCSESTCVVTYNSGCITGEPCFINDSSVENIFIKNNSIIDFCQINKEELELFRPVTKELSTFFIEVKEQENISNAISVKFNSCVERIDNKQKLQKTKYTETLYKWVVSN